MIDFEENDAFFIATDKVLFYKKILVFFLFHHENTLWRSSEAPGPCQGLAKALLMSTHNICFCGEMSKIIIQMYEYLHVHPSILICMTTDG